MNDVFDYYYNINNIGEEQFQIPEWAKNEHLERIVPQEKLWGLRFVKEKKKEKKPVGIHFKCILRFLLKSILNRVSLLLGRPNLS